MTRCEINGALNHMAQDLYVIYWLKYIGFSKSLCRFCIVVLPGTDHVDVPYFIHHVLGKDIHRRSSIFSSLFEFSAKVVS